ncbi:histidinol-phosphatase [Deinococcus arenae]|uniref:Histidinol-phosphatase n=2 Tax=Deinococcus arenae TaxID=1452751 RepID=A0A8H9GS52_9DEIO|nr:histidinol-phosphatase [Deinococcus arenae]
MTPGPPLPPPNPQEAREVPLRRAWPVAVVHAVQDRVGGALGWAPRPAATMQNNLVWRDGVQVMRMDLHMHTEVSHDCRTPLRDIPGWMLRTNTRVIAVTDHDQQRGGPELQAIVRDQGLDDRLSVIPGEEVTTSEGELIGLFLQERIPPKLTPEETVREIKAQGGLVLLQHGFDPLKRYRLRPEATERIAADIDIVETFNSRLSRHRWNRAAAEWARARGLPTSAGSDAHTLRDIGEAWTETPFRTVHTPAQLLEALREGVVAGRWTHPAYAFGQKQWRNFNSQFRR